MSDLGNKNIMAQNIKYYMSLKGVTQTEVCTTLNIKANTFSDWVNAKTYPRIDKIELLANYFGIEKSDLIEKQKDSPTEKLNDVYFSLAKSAQDEGIDPEDIKLAIKMIKTMRNRDGGD